MKKVLILFSKLSSRLDFLWNYMTDTDGNKKPATIRVVAKSKSLKVQSGCLIHHNHPDTRSSQEKYLHLIPRHKHSYLSLFFPQVSENKSRMLAPLASSNVRSVTLLCANTSCTTTTCYLLSIRSTSRCTFTANYATALAIIVLMLVCVT